MKELITKFWAAYDAQDWDRFEEYLALGFGYEEVATGRLGSAGDYVETLKKWKAGFPDSKAKLSRFYETDDNCVVEVEWSGTHKGLLETPFGSVPASNKPFRVRGVLIYTIKDGKIIESRSYFDLLGLMKQIGAGATLGAPAAKPEAEKRAVS
jgi:steroid delta-isomerase-like uncharacterized protein